MTDMEWIGIVGATVAIGFAILAYFRGAFDERHEIDDHSRAMTKLGRIVDYSRRLR